MTDPARRAVRASRGSRHRRTPVVALAAALLLGACGGVAERAPETVSSDDWDEVLAEAKGQTVEWYMYGGDQRLNDFVADEVAPRLAGLGVELEQVRVSDTADALNKVLGELRAGRTADGTVDAIWVNGENFATGRQAGAWRCGWVSDLPNARYLDLADPTLSTDFGTPVDGCEAPWQQANSALVHDSADLDRSDVASLPALLDWVEANPGRFTYAAPPDFTGSMVVRTVLYDTLGGPEALAGDFDEAAYRSAAADLWPRLRAVEDSLWRGGDTYPQSHEQVEKLYADGEISAYFTYGPGAVGPLVESGVFPETTRQAVLDVGNISNTSYVAIPANAADSAGALVLADVLLNPEVQLAMYRQAGAYPVLDLDRVDDDMATAFAGVERDPSVPNPRVLSKDALPELDSEYLRRLEEDWETEILRGD